ncbi:organic hydroperoxide resistance protein [Aliishimia ponticola]|uniref:Organic hydroperoxide resistance protein n=1 Tax=Aliishimia ponticola TaxID=2499833 RepID=A0A4V3XKA1_9RHOB|nr:organic hydroperoxide resistance protein [Aliishimia ponticola]THH36183.1 organic hydroperoxide resistance protein [Aliishimia ponticola]
MLSKIVYSTSATATGGGRDGHTALDDGSYGTDLAVPKEMGGPGGDALNPEKLFSLGYAACFMGALRFYAGQKKVAVPEDTKVTVETGIGPREDGGFGIDVKIKVSLPGLDEETAQDLIKGGHHVCPYSDATRGSLSISPELV